MKAWNNLCQPDPHAPPEFKLIYPNVTTVQGNRFQFRGGDQEPDARQLAKAVSNQNQRPRVRQARGLIECRLPSKPRVEVRRNPRIQPANVYQETCP